MKKLFFLILLMATAFGKSQSLVDMTIQDAIDMIETSNDEVLGFYPDGNKGKVMLYNYGGNYSMSYFETEGTCSRTLIYVEDESSIKNFRNTYNREYVQIESDYWRDQNDAVRVIISSINNEPVIIFGRPDYFDYGY